VTAPQFLSADRVSGCIVGVGRSQLGPHVD
jgi:hypothetical protein